MAAQTIPVRLNLPAGGDLSGVTATEDGVEYVPAESCPTCYAVVPQMYAAEHAAALHPEPPAEAATTPAF
jgi:hypothetical protein